MKLPPSVRLPDYVAGVQRLMDIPRKSKFVRVPWRDLDLPGPELEYLIDGYLTANEKSIIGGPSQSGKSFLAVQTAMSLSRGTDFFGAKVLKRGLVIYQAGEGALGIKKRLRAYRQRFNVPATEDVPFVLIPSKVDLYSPEGDTTAFIEECRAICAEYPGVPLVAIFIDTLATAQGGADENSGKDMAVVLGNIGRMQAELACHVCLVHHMNAAGGKLRGHTSVYSNVDQVILVEHNKETGIREAVLDKQKDDESGLRIRFRLSSVTLGLRPSDNKKITSCVCDPVETPSSSAAALKGRGAVRVSKNNLIAYEALMRALGEHGFPAPTDAGLPAGVRTVVSYDHWREAFAKISGDPDMSPEKVKSAMRRAGEEFLPAGVIGRLNTVRPALVWWTGKTVRGSGQGEMLREQEPQVLPDNVLPFERPDDLEPEF